MLLIILIVMNLIFYKKYFVNSKFALNYDIKIQNYIKLKGKGVKIILI